MAGGERKSYIIEVCPPVGKTPVIAANKTAKSARKKYGTLSEAYAKNELILSKSPPLRMAAITPSGMAIKYVKKIVAADKMKVERALCASRLETEIL